MTIVVSECIVLLATVVAVPALHATAPQPKMPAVRCQAGTAPALYGTGDRPPFGGACSAMGGFQYGSTTVRSTGAHDDHGSVSTFPAAADGRLGTCQSDGIFRYR